MPVGCLTLGGRGRRRRPSPWTRKAKVDMFVCRVSSQGVWLEVGHNYFKNSKLPGVKASLRLKLDQTKNSRVEVFCVRLDLQVRPLSPIASGHQPRWSLAIYRTNLEAVRPLPHPSAH